VRQRRHADALIRVSLWSQAQKALPQHALSRLLGRLARVRTPALKNTLNRAFVRAFAVDLSDARITRAQDYDSFNALFTRALVPGARPLAGDEATLVSPVDGTLSQCGPIRGQTLIQAKGRDYELADLLGSAADAGAFADGLFATIYLAPYNYHRIHMPAAGRLRTMRLVPGRLFSVNGRTAQDIDRLFARNERVVSLFAGARGPFGVVAVGALNVGSIATVWNGTVTPPAARAPRTWHYDEEPALARGAELGHFNFGSTVIVLLPPGKAVLEDGLAPGTTLRRGQSIGRWRNGATLSATAR
jgi:phosphatidylserine decarboxylase